LLHAQRLLHVHLLLLQLLELHLFLLEQVLVSHPWRSTDLRRC
jgi:hypothetical protein